MINLLGRMSSTFYISPFLSNLLCSLFISQVFVHQRRGWTQYILDWVPPAPGMCKVGYLGDPLSSLISPTPVMLDNFQRTTFWTIAKLSKKSFTHPNPTLLLPIFFFNNASLGMWDDNRMKQGAPICEVSGFLPNAFWQLLLFFFFLSIAVLTNFLFVTSPTEKIIAHSTLTLHWVPFFPWRYFSSDFTSWSLFCFL